MKKFIAKILNFIKKLMIFIICTVILYFTATFAFKAYTGDTSVYTNTVETVEEVKTQEVTDTVTEAERKLQEANKALDEEEASELAKIEVLKAEASQKIADITAKMEEEVAQRELRLEQINKVRSFQ